MSDTSAPAQSTTTERAGFWRRAAATFIDACLITLIIGLIGLLLFGPSGGYIRVSGMLLHSSNCSEQKPADIHIPVPPGFTVTHAYRCRQSILGYVFDQSATIAEITRSGAAIQTRAITLPIDANGVPTNAFYLDTFSIPLLAVYILLLEWRFGRTLGKDLMAVRVRSLDGRPLRFVQVALRLLIRSVPGVVAVAMLTLLQMIGAGTDKWLYLVMIWIVTFGTGLAFAINFLVATRRRGLPWHDRIAGTEVVRGR